MDTSDKNLIVDGKGDRGEHRHWIQSNDNERAVASGGHKKNGK